MNHRMNHRVPTLAIASCWIALTGCLEVGPAHRPSPPPRGAHTTTPKAPTETRPRLSRDRLLAWADAAIARNLDCPMDERQAAMLRRAGKPAYGAEPRVGFDGSASDAAIARSIGCACAVEYTCAGPTRPASHCDLQGALHDLRRKRGSRASNDALVTWVERLLRKQDSNVRALSRARPPGKQRPRLTRAEQARIPFIQGMRKRVATLAKLYRQRSYSMMHGYFDPMKKNLRAFERDVMCGRSSEVGRELLAKAERHMEQARAQLRALKAARRALSHNATYRRLQRKRAPLARRAKRLAQDHHIRNGDYESYCSNRPGDPSRMCALYEKIGRIDDQMLVIEQREYAKVGYDGM